MNVEILRHHFERGVQQAAHAAGRQTTLPILSHILLETERGQLKFSSTDLELGVQIWVPCKVKKEGKTTVPARTLSQLSSTITGEKIQIKLQKESLLEIKTGTTTARIKTLSPEDFPIIPSVRNNPIATVGESVLTNALQLVSPFVSSSEMRPELTGVFFRVHSNGSIILAATDSFRLAEKKLPKKTAGTPSDYSCIVPSKTAQELIRLFSSEDKDGDIAIMAEDNQLLFQGESAHLVTRLIEGNYPDYASLIPETTKITAILDKDAIVEGLKASGIFGGTHQEVTLSFKQKENHVVVAGRDIDRGESEVVVEGEVDGGDEEIIFNYRYLLEGLSGIETPDVIIGVNDSMKSGFLKPTRKEGFVYIIMPIKR